MKPIKYIITTILFNILFSQISNGNNNLISFLPDTFNYKTSENITKDYIHFLKKQGIDTVLVFYSSEGKSIKYINITNFIFLQKGNAYVSFHTTYPIESRKKGQIYFARNKQLTKSDYTKIMNLMNDISDFSMIQKNDEKPFNNMWKKRKWRKLYLFGFETTNQENIYELKAAGVHNRSYRNTEPSNHSVLYKQKRKAMKLYKLLKNYTSEELQKVLKS